MTNEFYSESSKENYASPEGRGILVESLRFRLREVSGPIRVRSGEYGDNESITFTEILVHDVDSDNINDNYAGRIIDLIRCGYTSETALIEYLVAESEINFTGGESRMNRVIKTIQALAQSGILNRNGDVLSANVDLPY